MEQLETARTAVFHRNNRGTVTPTNQLMFQTESVATSVVDKEGYTVHKNSVRVTKKWQIRLLNSGLVGLRQ